MRLSIRARVALLLAAMLVLSSVAVSLLTARYVGRSMRSAAETAASSALGLVVQNVRTGYADLQAHREHSLALHRAQLQNMSASVAAALDSFRALEESGALGRQAAQRAALDYLQSIRYGNDDYFFAYDEDMVAIAHPDPTIMGRDISQTVDAKGKPIGQEVKQLALTQGSGYIDFWWKRLDTDVPSPKLGYVFLYRPWNWIVGTGVYVDDLDRDAQQRLEQIELALTDALGQVTIAHTGFVFVIDDKSNRIAVAPRRLDLTWLEETATGRQLLAALAEGSRQTTADFGQWLSAPLAGGQADEWLLTARYVEDLDWTVVSAVRKSELAAPGRELILHQLAVNLGVLVLSLALGALLVNQVLRPLVDLAGHAEALPQHGFVLAEQAAARLERIAQRSRDEVGRLAGSFLAMERALQGYLAQLTATTATKERIESELRIAREIQLGTLPKIFPPFPDRPEVDIYASMEAAREVGGDLYDFFFVGDNTLCYLIGDVSGKGVPASLFMAISKTLVKVVAERRFLPGDILAKVNDDLSEENESCMFVSLFVALLDVRSGELQYANAGHNPPLLVTGTSPPRFLDTPHGPIAGVVPGKVYETHHLALQSGDMLFLYTDGVTEAEDGRGGFYGGQRLLEAVRQSCSGSARSLVAAVHASVADFVGSAVQSDDITMLALRFVGATDQATAAEPGAAVLRVPARRASFRCFQAFVAARTDGEHLAPAVAAKVDLVLEELLLNVLQYAYPEGTDGDVELACWVDGAAGSRRLNLRLRDWGIPFDPTTMKPPDLSADVASRPIGGLGIHLVKNIADEWRYWRQGDENVLEVSIRLA